MPTAHTYALPSVLPSHQRPSLPKLALSDLDQLWDLKLVHAPSTIHPWPAGFFARDMARAFAFIGEDDADEPEDGSDQKLSLAARFEYVFGRPFKSTTYQRSQRAWINSTQAQRDWMTDLPRSKETMWTVCRKKLDGWRKEMGHKQGQGKYAQDDDVESE
ncbi:hypothetical protein TRAPUB_12528 [Trametes pubescens]|uniref:Uncharacterized protein n=1 Tax=Trametes pubescens TaxID=154538 RepID=A0A1M2VTU2_TRAPU|nr:hypothetical protein TRAPUB_13385 [Trametes pubescens]OJT10133.1 hypothetical protein TRAPUB_13383 [Trametes pubescens]OJT10966.1 hypothetical protein TRAPUB_12528 [Trametes pubescens]